MAQNVHIIGAGLAGLAAAVKLAPTGTRLFIHEATSQAGGRCRSYFDRAIGMTIDNGNHLVLSGNAGVREFLDVIGSEQGLVGPDQAEYRFVDLRSGERWTFQIGTGLPWWMFDPKRRVPGTRLGDYLGLAKLLFVRHDTSIGNVVRSDGALYERLLRPLLLAALNIEPREGSTLLASAILRETLARGGLACRPLIARTGLGPVFIEPAMKHLRDRNVDVRLEHELRAIKFSQDKVAALDFGRDTVELEPHDAVILAVPPHAAAMLVPQLTTPRSHRAIANAHFKCEVPAEMPPITGVINATTEWIFTFEGRLSATVSNADRLMDLPREELARTIWSEVAAVAGIAGPLPPWQIVRERRATFAATPEENAKRPSARTSWSNLFLAGDWTATGLPAMLEGAARSGHRAAQLVIGRAS